MKAELLTVRVPGLPDGIFSQLWILSKRDLTSASPVLRRGGVQYCLQTKVTEKTCSSEVLKSISAHVGVFCMCAFVCVCVNARASVSALLKLYLCRCDVSKTFYVICM